MVVAIRILIGLMCAIAICIMTLKFIQDRHDWNKKTRDYWYSRMMWSFSGFFGMFEAIARGTPLRYSTVLVGAAALVTLKATLSSGSWGNSK